MYRIAEQLAKTGRYDYITVHQSWVTATGRVSKCQYVPDIIGVRLDGKIDAFHFLHACDDYDKVVGRLQRGMESLTETNWGDINILNAD